MNKVIVMGRLTKDPETRTTRNSKHVTHFTLAVRRRSVKEGAQTADFLPITAWGPLADFAAGHLKKGQLISMVGRSQSGTWMDIEGKKHYSVDIVADEIHFAESRRSGPDLHGLETSNLEDDGGEMDPDAEHLPFHSEAEEAEETACIDIREILNGENPGSGDGGKGKVLTRAKTMARSR